MGGEIAPEAKPEQAAVDFAAGVVGPNRGAPGERVPALRIKFRWGDPVAREGDLRQRVENLHGRDDPRKAARAQIPDQFGPIDEMVEDGQEKHGAFQREGRGLFVVERIEGHAVARRGLGNLAVDERGHRDLSRAQTRQHFAPEITGSMSTTALFPSSHAGEVAGLSPIRVLSSSKS